MSHLLLLLLSATAVSPRGAVASAHPLASEAAAAVLRDGGNAIDAAVAAALVLSVVEPESSGLGGGGFALVHLAREGRTVALDFREVAPAAARPDMFAGPRPAGAPSPSLDGGSAVAVPGAVKGYAELARRYGTIPFSRLVEPAARIAELGFAVGAHYVRAASGRQACLSARPAAARVFLVRGADGAPAVPAPGTRLRQPELARTLRLLGRDPEAFYRGPLAAAIVRAARADGGALTAADLGRLPRPRADAALGHVPRLPDRLHAAPVLGRRDRHRPAPGARARGPARRRVPPRALPARHREVEKQLYARRALLGDPAFVPGATREAER